MGSATLEPGNPSNCIQITPLSLNVQGWVYSTTFFDLTTDQSLEFDMYLGNNDNGADGIVFVLHNDPEGFNAHGCPGSVIGYGGSCAGGGTKITPSFAVEIDTYYNNLKNDPIQDHIAFMTNGDMGHPSVFPGYLCPENIEDGTLRRFRFEWTAATNTASVFWKGTKILETVFNIPAHLGTTQAYWGFTGATGNQENQQYFCSDLGVTLNQPLPIVLTRFEAKVEKEQIKLHWATATELNNQFFVVEKSVDGKNFSELAKIDGAGNSNTTREYTLWDKNPWLGDNYYRLKQIDMGGVFTYSPIRYVNFKPKNKPFESVLFPNPVKRGTMLQFKTEYFSQKKLTIKAQNILGQIIDNQSINLEEKNQLLINLPSGVYLLMIYDQNRVIKQKLVVE